MANEISKIDLIFSLGLSGLMFMMNLMLINQDKIIGIHISMFNFLFGCIISIVLSYMMKQHKQKAKPKL